MLKIEAKDILSKTGWLASAPEQFRAAMLPNCDLIMIGRGQTFFNAGDETGGICGIAGGQLEIHVATGVGSATLAYLCGVGHWFGEIAAADGGKRRVTIVAAMDTQLLRLSLASMHRLAIQHPEAWMHFARLLAKNLAIAIDVMTAIRFEEPLLRVAATLRNLVGADRSSSPKIAVSQSDLGAMTGLSRNTVNISLAELERLAIVRRGYGVVEITDLAGLRGIVTNEKPGK